MVFQCSNIREVPREVLKTAASDLANVNARKTMFDPYILIICFCLRYPCCRSILQSHEDLVGRDFAVCDAPHMFLSRKAIVKFVLLVMLSVCFPHDRSLLMVTSI